LRTFACDFRHRPYWVDLPDCKSGCRYEKKAFGSGSSHVNALLERGADRGLAFGDAVLVDESGNGGLVWSASTLLLPAKSFAIGAIRPRGPSPYDLALREPASLLRSAGPRELPGASGSEERFEATFEIYGSQDRQSESRRFATPARRSFSNEFF
jgi:hypothetical protein